MAQFTNQAQLRYGNAITSSNVAVGEILEVLSVTKRAVNRTYDSNGTITYIISIINSGSLPINTLTLTDNLGAYSFGTGTLVPLTYISDSIKYYINGVAQTAPVITQESPLIITGLNLPAGGNLIVVYDTAINQFAPLAASSEITNTVTISGTGITSTTAEETVTANKRPLLTITKSISPVPVTENGTLTYTFLIQNEGNTAADESSGIIVTDLFDPILSNLTVTLNGRVLTENTDYTYQAATGEFATIAGRITVPSATFTTVETTGEQIVTPGLSTLIVTGTV